MFNSSDFKNGNQILTAKLLKKVSRIYNIHIELIVKYNIGLKILCNRAYLYQYFMVIQFII